MSMMLCHVISRVHVSRMWIEVLVITQADRLEQHQRASQLCPALPALVPPNTLTSQHSAQTKQACEKVMEGQ